MAAGIIAGCKTSENNFTHESENWKLSHELTTEQVKPGLQRQVMCYNDDIMLVKVISHPHSQSSYILSGKFEYHCGDKVQILSAGDSFYAEPDMPHEAYCLEPGIIIDGFSPIREDFMK